MTPEDDKRIQKLVVSGSVEAINTVVIPVLDSILQKLNEHDNCFDGLEGKLELAVSL